MPSWSIYNMKEEEENNHSDAEGQNGAAAVKSNKPENTPFKQQRLAALQPVLTAGTVFPAFFVMSLIFIPIGIVLLVISNNITEFQIDYTGVEQVSPCYDCAHNFNWTSTKPCTCSVPFTLEQPFESDVFMYYGLSNFYQNHRRYVKSRDDRQLNGDQSALKNPSKECEPYRLRGGLPIAPCGAIANSLFNDVLELYYIDSGGTRHLIPLVKKGIAWSSDKHGKFRNPHGDGDLATAFQGTAQPVNWTKPVFELDPSDGDNNGLINEDLIVWMRTAALPTFRKLYRIIHKSIIHKSIIHKSSMNSTLPSGNYSLEVVYNYPVLNFDGRKRMILSTTSSIGSKNPFLGIAYITVGSLCFVLGMLLLIVHHKYRNRNNNNNYFPN